MSLLLTGEQVTVLQTKDCVFVGSPAAHLEKATHVIVMECVQSFILILGALGGGVG